MRSAAVEEDGDGVPPSSSDGVVDAEAGADVHGEAARESGEEEEGEEEEGEEEEEEEEEPRLKYQRLGASVAELLKSDTARCLAVHTRFLALGTGSGLLVLLDFNGNEVRRFATHSSVVNDICVDAAGEYVGSCSEDGTVAIHSLYNASEATTHFYHQPVKAIALDPEFSAGRRVFACGGLGGQLILNSRGWFGAKDDVLHAGEGTIHAIKWHGALLAWANDLGVKVFDCYAQQRISYIDRPPNSPSADAFRPQLAWASASCLVIGWADTIKVGVVRQRAPTPAPSVAAGMPLPVGVTGQSAPTRYIEIVHVLRTDGYICGVAPVRLPLGGFEAGAAAEGEGGGGKSAASAASAASPDAAGSPSSAGGAGSSAGSRSRAAAAGAASDGDGASGGAEPSSASTAAAAAKMLLAVLVYSCESNDEESFASGASAEGHAERPELRLLTTENVELSSDALSLHHYARHRAAAYCVALQPPPPSKGAGAGAAGGATPPRGGAAEPAADARAAADGGGAGAPPRGSTPGAEGAREPLLYVVSPFDIVVVRSRDVHDHVRWLLEHGRFEAALTFARSRAPALRAQQLLEVSELYLRHLLDSGAFAKAASMARELLGVNSALWNRWLLEFAKAGKLPVVVDQLPTRPPALLDRAVYELVLLHLLRTDASELYRLVCAWPVGLYRAAEVLTPALLAELRRLTGRTGGLSEVSAEEAAMAAAGFVARAAERGREDEPAAATLAALTSALAELYARSGRLDTSLQLWLALRSRRILAFVREHSMVGGVRHHAKLLVQLDRAAAIELLAAHHATVEPASVVRQLSAEPRAVHEYLHALFLRDARAGAAFHSQQVELYARFAPAELRLFLAQSSECSLEAALATCEAHGLQREVVYILSRMGAQRAALDRILSELDDVPYALAFVREQADAELTDALLAHALHSASRAAELLRHLSGEDVGADRTLLASRLLRRLPRGMVVPGWRAEILRILRDCSQRAEQVSTGSRVVAADACELAAELSRAQRRAIAIVGAEPPAVRPAEAAPPPSGSLAGLASASASAASMAATSVVTADRSTATPRAADY